MNKFVYGLAIALGGIACLYSAQGHAGMVVNGTRFVLTASEHAKGITVKNTGKVGFLVKSQVFPDNGGELEGTDHSIRTAAVGNPFVITPPLFLLGAGKSSQLRLECLSCQELPNDRESLYRLGISAIPGGKPAANTVQLAVRSTFKLFYRPAGLAGNAAQAYQQLKWKREGKNVVIHNPTPYYVTLFELKINNKEVHGSGMVAPFSSRTRAWCPATGKCDIEWKSLNDFGGITPAWTVSPATVAKAGHGV